jgi:glyoxylase-like metal-dependent hydrolase (beta-lactamase superfamily II)
MSPTSHIHWDHFDGADLFPAAQVWVQREEAEHHVDSVGGVRNRAIHAADARMLHTLRGAGRLTLVDGDAQQVLPGIRVFTGGKHTFASQYVAVRTRQGVVVIASDNAYLYENLDRRLPIAQTLDAASNLAAQARMATIATPSTLIVPGHDPQVFNRFPLVNPRIARIR